MTTRRTYTLPRILVVILKPPDGIQLFFIRSVCINFSPTIKIAIVMPHKNQIQLNRCHSPTNPNETIMDRMLATFVHFRPTLRTSCNWMGMKRLRRTNCPIDICQRVQKSVIDVARKGALKFIGVGIP